MIKLFSKTGKEVTVDDHQIQVMLDAGYTRQKPSLEEVPVVNETKAPAGNDEELFSAGDDSEDDGFGEDLEGEDLGEAEEANISLAQANTPAKGKVQRKAKAGK